MKLLYPDIKPYARHRLAVGDGHELYLEESGTPEGIPVLFVHGGPGSGCGAKSRCFFDPEHYRIILFDQRGAGRSTPHAGLKSNTTAHLIADMEAIRAFLDIESWLLFGGSWGATLSLLYAQQYPEQLLGLILRGVFLCRDEDLRWFYQHGASQVFPDYWQDFQRPIAVDKRHNMIAAYHELLTGNNELARMSAAKSWSLWEARCATLRPSSDVVDHFSDPHVAIALACIETQYFLNKAYIEPNQIIAQAGKLAGIPGIIIHGRYDMICPLDNALALHQVWPDSELDIVRDAGHSSTEPSIIDALVRATADMSMRIRPEISPSS